MQYSHMSLTERRKAIAKAVKAAKNEAATVIQRAFRTRKAKKGGRHRRTHRKV